MAWAILFVFMIVVVLFLVGGGCYVIPKYHVWQQGLSGEAELNRASSNRKIAIQEAEAKREAAAMLAGAEVERAKGVAKANEIIGASLKENEGYLRYLWIQEMGSAGHVIYIPTEAGMPILEAGRGVHVAPTKEAK